MLVQRSIKVVEMRLAGACRSAAIVALAAAALQSSTVLGLAPPEGAQFYSTAAPDPKQDGPSPSNAPLQTPAHSSASSPASGSAVSKTAAPREEPSKIASSASAIKLDRSPAVARPAANSATTESIEKAFKLLAECQSRLSHVSDYTCTFIKRERINGKLYAPHSMHLKVRNQPMSVYLKFIKPYAGREAIYIAGRHNGKVVAHDVGIGKLVAGTLLLDPKGSRAMEDNRHPITEAGLANMLNLLEKHWKVELKPEDTKVTILERTHVGERACTMIETFHATKIKGLQFAKVRVFIDHELGLPIRFEAYDWGRDPGVEGQLVEEYNYVNLKLNVGLTEADFDPNNGNYAYGRL